MVGKNPLVCLLGASFGTNNMGVNVLTVGTIKSLVTRFPDAEIFLLDYGREGKTHEISVNGKSVHVMLENIRFSKKFYLKNNIAMLLLLALIARIVPFGSVRERIIRGNHWLKRVSDTDLVASIAGGDSFSDIYGPGRFIYVTLPQILAIVMGKKLVLLPQTIGPFKGRAATAVARYIMKKAEIVYSRDYEGLEYARKLLGPGTGNEGKFRFCHDVGFVLDPALPEKADRAGMEAIMKAARPLVGLNISGLLYGGGYTGRNMFGLKSDYKELIGDIVEFMISKKNASVVLVPHVFGTHGESDAVVCEAIYAAGRERYGDRLLIARGEYNQSEIKHVIGLCDFFMGARMHACIAALSQNVPTVSIAYSRKFIGVMQTIGVADLVADPRKLEKGDMLKVIDDAFEKRAEWRRHLEETMPRVRENVLGLFGDMDSVVKGGKA